ncbi:MAG TPA: hypothetical protein VFW43_03685, partial [Polaromonas sp.]|nr:hypothetical protein [Polaromonas sp.]
QAHLVGLDAIDEQSAAALLFIFFYARLHFGARLQGDLQFGIAFLPRGAKKRVLDNAFLALCWLGSTPKERVRRACQRRQAQANESRRNPIWSRFGAFRPFSLVFASAGCSVSS